MTDDGARLRLNSSAYRRLHLRILSMVNLSERMMNNPSRSIFIGTALAMAMALAGCQKSDPTMITSNGVPPEPVTNAAPIPQMPKGDRSVPDAATVFAAQDAAEKAKAMQDTATQREKPAPQEPMTASEESKAMPLPAQANDHSNTALDKSNGG